MPTPLYDAVKKYADQEPFRFHMPGHKGGPVPLMAELKWMTPIDLTELPPTGNLYEGGEPFASAQALWAKEFGFEYCQFSPAALPRASTPDWPCVVRRGVKC